MPEAGGPEDQFEEIFRRHHRDVTAYARRRVHADAVDDVVAEVFLVAWRHLSRAPDEPLSWLYRIASNAVANQRRGDLRLARLRGRLATAGQPVDRSRAEEQRDHSDAIVEADRVRLAVSKLTERDREAFRLTTWEGLSVNDAATVMGVSAIAMKVRLHRARRLLARLLGDDAAGAPPPSQDDGETVITATPKRESATTNEVPSRHLRTEAT